MFIYRLLWNLLRRSLTGIVVIFIMLSLAYLRLWKSSLYERALVDIYWIHLSGLGSVMIMLFNCILILSDSLGVQLIVDFITR